ncbi:MAG: hypothetical protein R2774_16235 [Saprospiraceae bacterium]
MLSHYASGWGGGSRAGITTYSMSRYGRVLGKYSNIGTGLLGIYNIGTGMVMDGGYGYNAQLATAQTAGGWLGAYYGGKLGALGLYFGPLGSIVGGVGGAVIGGFAGTSICSNIYKYFNK